mgnify:CR=1 FL=1|tara:strand:- start:57 stop:710 length:654 start_codon:yes stop_codon:yes gene_type:complete
MKTKLKSNSINFYWEGTELRLYSNQVLFVVNTKELLISDVHIGKAEYFQLNGIPLTNNQDETNINRIYRVIDKLKPLKLVILGDLFHSKYSLNKNLLNKLDKLFKYIKNVELIEGNHDRGCFIKNITYLKKKKSLNLIYSHEPLKTTTKGILNICGHYHPKIVLKNKFDKLSFKCFALDSTKNNLFLPSFGDLTGGYLCKKHFKKWAIISENNIIEV